MAKEDKITSLFLDIGGVLLTGGWDRTARHLAVTQFKLDEEELNERHHLTFDTYESGKLTLDEYLYRIVFYQKRNFSKDDFKKFMFAQSKPIKGSIEYFKMLKKKQHLKIIAVNNEGRELNEFRVRQFGLDQLFDGFISSCYVHLRKPDADIFRLACEIAQKPVSEILYIDDRLMFIQVAATLGIRGYHFREFADAKKYLESVPFSGTQKSK